MPKNLRKASLLNQRRDSKLSITTFNFGTEVIPLIIKEIDIAEKYIRIAIFQMHREDLFSALAKKIADGIKVEILTLPYDSINDVVRPEVEKRFKELENIGANIYFDKWNVGDPSRTTTAVGRWYSFHGKFIVTDKSAIALSANFTKGQELDAAIIFRGDEGKISEFNTKFEELLQLFVIKDNDYDGSIRRKILNATPTNETTIFELPKNIDPRHKDHWIRHYPIEICPSNVIIQEKLYLTPFDCRGRDFFRSIIENAEKYAYISTESFTDEEFSSFLVNVSVNKDLDIKILSGATSMDFTDRIENMFRDLIAQEIEIKTTEEDIHAKLVITDKILAVSSVNLNKMNLGFYQTHKFWRENTESILICKDPELIRTAKEKYLETFNSSYNVKDKLSQKLEGLIKEIFKGCFQLSPDPNVRVLFAKFILKRQIDTKKIIMKIGKITKKLMDHYRRTRVEKQDFVSALVLYYLSERKQEYSQLEEKMNEIDGNINLKDSMSKLILAGLIEQEGDWYKINIEALAF
jgi:phosphatidylserine/phosphatidylglycerophosphate/cardiolipin synthase-like enzyme